MTQLSCPKCDEMAIRGGCKVWQIVLSICLFPVGLLAFLADRNPTECPKCGHTWQAYNPNLSLTKKIFDEAILH